MVRTMTSSAAASSACTRMRAAAVPGEPMVWRDRFAVAGPPRPASTRTRGPRRSSAPGRCDPGRCAARPGRASPPGARPRRRCRRPAPTAPGWRAAASNHRRRPELRAVVAQHRGGRTGVDVVGEREPEARARRPAGRCSRWSRAGRPAARRRRGVTRSPTRTGGRRAASRSGSRAARRAARGSPRLAARRPSGAAPGRCGRRCPAPDRCPGRCGRGAAPRAGGRTRRRAAGAWFGSMTPPEPTRRVEVAAARWAMSTDGTDEAMRRGVVVLGDPVAGEAERLGPLGERRPRRRRPAAVVDAVGDRDRRRGRRVASGRQRGRLVRPIPVDGTGASGVGRAPAGGTARRGDRSRPRPRRRPPGSRRSRTGW